MTYVVHAKMFEDLIPSRAWFLRHRSICRICRAAAWPLAVIAYLGLLTAPAGCVGLVFQVLRWLRIAARSGVYWVLIGLVGLFALWTLWRIGRGIVYRLHQKIIDLDLLVGLVGFVLATALLVWMAPSGDVPTIPNKAPAPNRRPRFPLGTLAPFGYSVCAPPAFPAAVGEAQR